MKTKIRHLLEKSQALGEETKEKYLRVLDFLPENELLALLTILQNEQEGIAAIEEEMKKEESQLNEEYLVELEDLYKKEYKKAVAAEEKEEKAGADELLKKIEE